jgi:peptidoglycan hydrolase-like protein with peptidoglycan-binding domain
MEVLGFYNFISEAETDGKLGFLENSRKQLEKMKGRIANQINLADNLDSIHMKDFEDLFSEIDQALNSFKDFKARKKREIASALLDKEAKLMDKISKEGETESKKIIDKVDVAGDMDKNLKASFAEVILSRAKYLDIFSKYNEEVSSKIENTKDDPKFDPIKTGQKDTEKDGKIRKVQIQLMSKNRAIEQFLKSKGAPNGVYGKGTTSVVKSVQKSLGLEPDGILTPEIYSKIMENKIGDGGLMMFESFVNEAKDKIDWELVAKDLSSYKEDKSSSKVDKIKVDERLKLLGDFKDQSVADNLVKVLEIGGLVSKTDKGNPAVAYKGFTFYKNGRFLDKKSGKKGSIDVAGLKYDDGKSLTWEEFKKETEKSSVSTSKMEGLVREFMKASFGNTEDENQIFEVFRKIKSKEEFNKFEEIWDSLRFDKSQIKLEFWANKKFDTIRKENSSVKDPIGLRKAISNIMDSGEISRLNGYLPDGIDKF